MPQISRARVLFAGLIAGLVIDSIEYLLDSFVFSDNWGAVAALVSPPSQKPPPSFAINSTLILAFLQLAGILAGMLAMRFYRTQFHRRAPSARKPAMYAWALVYGPICAALVIVSAQAKDPAHPPMPLVQGIAFAASALVGCLAGTSLGGWVYRESEAAAHRVEVQAQPANTGTDSQAQGANT